MDQKQNLMLYVIITLVVGGVVGYALAGGFAAGGKAIAAKCGPGMTYNTQTQTCISTAFLQKLQSCPEGTIYDPETNQCISATDAPKNCKWGVCGWWIFKHCCFGASSS